MGPLKLLAVTFVTVALSSISALGEDTTLTIIGWNLQSGDSDPANLAEQCARKGDVDIWGFSEVANQSVLDTIEARVEQSGAQFDSIISSNSGGDKLGVLFNSDRLELIEEFEERSIQLGNPFLRPAFGAVFEGKETGQRFLFMVNHLKANSRSGNAANVAKRVEQSKLLNDLAEVMTMPVICCGDFNYLYKIDVEGGDSEGFDELVKDDVFQLVPFERLVKTEDTRGSRVIFDFVFVANRVAGWDGEAMIMERDRNEPAVEVEFGRFRNGRTDNDEGSDHRPVKAVFTFTDETWDDAAEELRERIAVMRDLIKLLEEQLDALEANSE